MAKNSKPKATKAKKTPKIDPFFAALAKERKSGKKDYAQHALDIVKQSLGIR